MTAEITPLDTDCLQPFMLYDAHVRGRIVRLGAVVDTILKRHAYPPAVSHLLGELLSVAALLSSNLKHEGIFTLQLRGNGPVALMVADATFGGALRGYAQLRDDACLDDTLLQNKNTSPRLLMGDDSYLAITLDPGQGMQRYQGVVALEGESLAEALQCYFTHSQQLDVLMVLACDTNAFGTFIASGLMIERVANAGGVGALAMHASQPHNNADNISDAEDMWHTCVALTHTVSPAELLDATLPQQDLLFRLYHEASVRITPAHPVSIGCRCSRERILDVLMSMQPADRAEMLVDGAASVTCQFCNQTEIFSAEMLGVHAKIQ